MQERSEHQADANMLSLRAAHSLDEPLIPSLAACSPPSLTLASLAVGRRNTLRRQRDSPSQPLHHLDPIRRDSGNSGLPPPNRHAQAERWR